MFDPRPFRTLFKVGTDLAFEIPVDLSVDGHFMAQELHYIRAGETGHSKLHQFGNEPLQLPASTKSDIRRPLAFTNRPVVIGGRKAGEYFAVFRVELLRDGIQLPG